jgi:hypothetical protein
MSKYLVKEHRVEVERGGEVKFMLLGYDVLETTHQPPARKVNNSPMMQDEARTMAAVLEWKWHLDQWMTTIVEDEDVVEDVGEILGLVGDIPLGDADDDEISKAYDQMIVGALELLPAGLRLLADTYEAEWRNKHGKEAAAV